MNKKLSCIMLVDDNNDDNFFHERVIRKNGYAETIVVKQTGKEALEHLKRKTEHEDCHPELILLDINMPGMNGWEFLEEYEKLEEPLKAKIVVVMLTTSENLDDKLKAEALGLLSDFKNKPLTREMLDDVLEKFFH